MIKVRANITAIETKKYTKNQQNKKLVIANTNKIDKPLVNRTKIRRENPK
jgi:hypothetical protein